MSFASQNCDNSATMPTTPDPADAPAAGVELEDQ